MTHTPRPGARRALGAGPSRCAKAVRSSLPALFLLAAPAVAAQSSAFVQQVGSHNAAEVVQTASGQVGIDGHTVLLKQADGSTADVVQTGRGNTLAGFTLGQVDPEAYAVSFDGSDLVLRQVDGQNNQAFVDQRDGALAEILQSGSDNVALVVQAGGLNRAFVTQTGGGTASILQNGSNNVARVTQSPF